MFTAVSIMRPESSIFSRMRYRIFPPKTSVKKITVSKSCSFYLIEAAVKKNEIPWEEIKDIAGRSALRLVLPPDISPPEGSGIGKFFPDRFERIVMMNTMLYILKMCRFPPQKLRLSIIDWNADFLGSVGKLSESASLVRIITNKPKKYEKAAETLMEEKGAALMISDDISSAKNSNIVFAPFGISEEADFSEETYLFVCGEYECGGGIIIKPAEIALPVEIADFLPQGHSPTCFAGALYEMCGMRSLEKLIFKRINVHGLEINSSDAASYISFT